MAECAKSASVEPRPGEGGTRAGRVGYSRSAAMRSGCRLVVTIRSPEQLLPNLATSEAASTICSRLSRSKSAFLSPMSETTRRRASVLGLLHVQRDSESRKKPRGIGDVGQRE